MTHTSRFFPSFPAWCFLVLAVLMLLGLPATGQAVGMGQGTDAMMMVPGHVGENIIKEEKPVDDTKWPYPTWGYDRERNTDVIPLAFPQDEAVFPRECMVTLGWQPYANGDIPVERYEILVSNDLGMNTRLTLGTAEAGKATAVLYHPENPARYFWQVWAFFEDGRAFASTGRHFTVMP